MRNEKALKSVFTLGTGFPMVLRYAVYTLLIFAVTTSLPSILRHGNIDTFKEGGWIEWCQLILLGATSGIYLYEAFFSPPHEKIFYFLGGLSAFALVRELDALLDRLIPLIGWKIGLFIVFHALYSAYMNRKAFNEQIRQFLATHSIVLLWAGFIVAVPVGQLIGHGDFLQALMGDDYLRDYKRVIEESLELMGYILVLAGSIEAAIELRGHQQD